MRNLLSNKDKKAIHREYLLRITGISIVFIFFSIFIGIVSLLPSYFLSQVKEEEIRNQVEITKESVAMREQESSAEALVEARQKLDLLVLDKQKTSITKVFDVVVRAKPENVFLSGLSFNARSGGKSEFRITGVAARRDALLSFKRFLEKEALFESVDLPVSNLASDQDIEFSIRITGDF